MIYGHCPAPFSIANDAISRFPSKLTHCSKCFQSNHNRHTIEFETQWQQPNNNLLDSLFCSIHRCFQSIVFGMQFSSKIKANAWKQSIKCFCKTTHCTRRLMVLTQLFGHFIRSVECYLFFIISPSNIMFCLLSLLLWLNFIFHYCRNHNGNTVTITVCSRLLSVDNDNNEDDKRKWKELFSI